jgi:hypothetical protein
MEIQYSELTLRDYFAALTLNGFAANSHWAKGTESRVEIAEFCYVMADEMLKARSST